MKNTLTLALAVGVVWTGIAQSRIRIDTASLPDAIVNTPYSQQLSAKGAPPPFTWSLTLGSLPPGLQLTTDGVISGTPSAAGRYPFVVQAVDRENAIDIQPLAIAVFPAVAIVTSALPPATVGAAYNQVLAASGGTPPMQWSLSSGALPTGLNLRPNGNIAGVPSAPGTQAFTVTVTDSRSATDSRSLSIAAVAPLAVATGSLPPGTVAVTYQASLAAVGGAGNYSWSIVSGALPAGLSLSGDGTIAGIPSVAGTANFTVQVKDSPGSTATAPLAITIAPPQLIVSTTALPNATVGTAYQAALTAVGGTGGYTWTIAAGALPPGLSIGNDGTLSGTPTTAGNATFTVQVTDSSRTTATAQLTIAVAPPPLAVSSTTLPGGTVGTAYQATLTATGGTGGYTWTTTAGTLPAGLSLNPSGAISGTPTAAGTSTFTVQVTDSSKTNATAQLTLVVAPPPLAVSSTTLPNGTVGTAYQATLTATGGTGGYTWTTTAGTLPAGLSLNPSGAISGTPTAPGTSTFTIQVTDSSKTNATAQLSIVVAPPPLAVSSTALPNGTVGTAYQATLTATGGTGGYTWTTTAGTLPAGLSLNPSGAISGTPTAAGTSNFTVQVTDSSKTSATAQLSIVVAPPPLTVSSTTLPNATVGTAYQATLAATGGTGGYTWSIASGTLPAGLSLNASGAISGTPTTAGPSTFTVQVTDNSKTTATAQLTITVAAPPLTVSSTTLPNATVGTAYQATLTATGGTGGYTWTTTAGTLPAGLSLNPSGAISGTPTTAGSSSFTVQVTDSSKTTATAQLAITVAPPQLTVSNTTLPNATVGAAYQATLTATGGTGGYAWSIASGTLPPGLSLNGSGAISGTPTTAGTSSFTVQVTDSSKATATAQLTIAVAPPQLTVSGTTLPNATVGAVYQATLGATGGTGGYAWSIASGTLPPGLSLNGSGAISGTPTTPGTSSFTVQVTDSSKATATAQLAIAVAPPQLTVSSTTVPNGTVGVAYQAALSATGGAGGYTWTTAAGALPAGLSLGADGSITGTPTTAGTSTFTVQVTDASKATATAQLTIAVAPAQIIVSTTALPNATVGTAYQATLSATGGAGGYTWTTTSGTLPAGLSLNPSGSISGTPTTPGTATFTVQVTDNSKATATAQLTIAVAPPQLTVSTTTIPNATVGTAYQATLSATGGAGGYTWTTTAGALPAGLSLAPAGTITGTPTAAGTSTFTVQVADSAKATATAQLTIATSPAPLTISTSSLPAAAVGVAYQQPLSATGGAGTYSWSVASGILPAGLALSRAGLIAGTPTAPGPATFTVSVTDGATNATRNFTIPVESQVSVVTSALHTGTVGTAYTEPLVATGGAAPYTWSISSGQLPSGLTLDPSTGIISGTPTLAGTFRIGVQVADSTSAKATANLSLTINKALSIATTTTLATGSAGSAYTQAFAASGGVPPYSWSLTGTLPSGLSFNATTGALSGTPTQVGTFPVNVQVVDSAGIKISGSFSVQIVSGLAIATPPILPPATSGVAYTTTLQPAGGSSPYQWTVTAGALPAGLSFASGQVSGTPTSTGTFTFTAQVTDANSARAQKAFTLVVAGPLSITSTTLPAGATQAPYSQTLSASGGTPPYSWSVSAGKLPDGLTLEAPSGVLAGTPTAAGTFNFTASVTDANGIASQKQFTVIIGEGLSFASPASLPSATAGVAYTFTLQASGGRGPYSWTVSQGALPPGLALNGTSGVLSGTPSTTGTFNFTLQVSDAAGMTATRVHTIVIGVPPLPKISIQGLSSAVQPLAQPLLDVALANPYPVAITGTVSLSFTPRGANPVDDPAVQFSTGGRSATFTIPANATHATFGAPQFAVQTGSVTGTITLSVVALQAGGSALGIPDGLSQTSSVDPAPPVIRSVAVVRTPTGLEIQITAMSNTRELTQASITFQPAPGTSIQNTQLAVPLADVAKTWFQSQGSAAFGGQFGLTLPFTFNGSVSVSSVTVVLTNAIGDSAPSSANY